MNFGSSGIRDRVNTAITVDFVRAVGAALPSHYRQIVVGRDARTSSVMLHHALRAGILSAGGDCIDAGLVPTPTLAYAARAADCGVMITASHNPPEYNGLKFWNPDGSAFDADQRELVSRALAGREKTVAWNAVGAATDYAQAIDEHSAAITERVSLKKPLTVVVDCGNGAGAVISPFVLRRLGCRVITLNAQPDGHFPGRPSEPSEKNTLALQKAVVATHADLGIAHDGDADRMTAVDEQGHYIGGDTMACLLAKRTHRKKIVVPLDTTKALDDVVDGSVIRDRVGDAYISERLKKEQGDFGGESSGAWIFPEISYCPDGIYAAALLAELVSGEALSALAADVPRYATVRAGIACENKDVVMAAVSADIGAAYDTVTTLDGVRVDVDDGWFLIRPSGTEPKIRITAEARTEKRAKELYDRGFMFLKSHIT